MGTGRVGVVISGCGDLTQRAILPHLREADVRQEVSVVGLYDVDVSRARDAANRFQVAHVANNLGELLALPGAELAIIASPMAVHAEQAIAALRSGKHLYLQKPLATTVDDANRVLAEAARSPAKVVVAPVQRLCPAYRHIQSTLREGEIGSVFWALTANQQPLAPGLHDQPRSWLTGQDAGPVRDTTLYSLTLLTDLFGPVKHVVGASNRRQRPVFTSAAADDNTLMTLELDDGVLAVATGSYAVAGRLVAAGFLGIYGTHGSIETVQVDPVTWLPTQVELCTRDQDGQISSRVMDCPLSGVPHLGGRHARLPEAQVHADIMHLVQCILSDTAPLATVEQARHLVEVIEQAAAAAQNGVRQCIESRFPFPRREC